MSARSFHNLLVHLFPDAGRIEIDVVLFGVLHRLLHGEEVLRNDVCESLGCVLPVGEQSGRECGACFFGMLLDQTVHDFVRLTVERFEQQRAVGGGSRVDLLHVKVEHVHVATGEACAEVATRGTEDHDGAAGHVFATMVADALHHEGGAAVAHAEAFACTTCHEHLAGSGTEAGDVARDHVLMRIEGDARLRTHDHASAGKSLARVVVDFAVHADGLATRNERADGLAARTMERHVDGVVRQAFLAVTLGDLVADHGAERTVHVTDRHLDAHRLLLLKGGLRELDELKADRTDLARRAAERPQKAQSLRAKVLRLISEIAGLGPVNHAALEHLEAVRRTLEATARQVEDLEKGIETLEAAIRKIDAETRGRLRETFEEVNGHFAETFSELFGGGVASLVMSGDDVLNAGVEVKAQPPGKKNAGVKLLSGGEQALAATALVFAIFRLNPAPFCLLDEVDAPLDEANQARLAGLCRRMSSETQFLMITHHRVTMEFAGALVGVTMKEPGVSRVVSVDIENAVRMAN